MGSLFAFYHRKQLTAEPGFLPFIVLTKINTNVKVCNFSKQKT